MLNRMRSSVVGIIYGRPPGPRPPTGRTIFLGPVLVGVLIAYIFIGPPQAREAYLTVIADHDWPHGLIGLLGMLWLSAALFAWNTTLVNKRLDLLYEERPIFAIDQWLKDVRDLKAVVSASLPLLALTYGLFAAIPGFRLAAQRIADHGDEAMASVINSHRSELGRIFADLDRLQAALGVLPQPFLVAATGVGLICAGWLLALVGLRAGKIVARIHLVSRLVAALIYALPLLVVFKLASAETFVRLARLFGPVGVTALIGIVAVPTLELVVMLVRGLLFDRLFVPVISLMTRFVGAKWLAISAAGFVASLVATHHFTQDDAIERIRKPTALDVQGSRVLDDDFMDWLKQRGVLDETLHRSKPYPVFIVAAQGGGIYAASSAMTLLTRLQDENPAFAQHIFAISAVSGGALGSSVFRGLVAQSAENRASRALREPVQKIAIEDHISPLLLATPIDWASKVPGLLGQAIPWTSRAAVDPSRDNRHKVLVDAVEPLTSLLWELKRVLEDLQTHMRSVILQESFLESYRRHSPMHTSLGLNDKLSDYWSGFSTPALVLGATSVETGHRVAFSPFSFVGVGDKTLHAFSDMARQLAMTRRSWDEYHSLDIINAAVTSARFPGVLPAWPIEHSGPVLSAAKPVDGRLNFVDGGYADGSGATTAADIILALKAIAEKRNIAHRVSFHLILITDSESNRDIPRLRGTGLPDVIAPTTALLESRELLANAAIARAKSQLAATFVSDANHPLIEVVLDQRIFPLPLGWLLSRHTNEIIGLMLGEARSCPRPGPGGGSETLDQALESGEVNVVLLVRKNSCAQRQILQLMQ